MEGTPDGGRDVERELRAHVAVEERPGPEPTPSPPVRARLRRRAEGRWVAGVAGGLADHWGVPVLALRLAPAVAGLVTGAAFAGLLGSDGGPLDPSDGLIPVVIASFFAAVAAYLVLWGVLPREDVGRSPARRFGDRYPGVRAIPRVALLVVGGALLAEQLGIWEPDVALAIGLIALGVWLYRRDATDAASHAITDVRTGASVSEPAAAAATREPRPPRERSPLGWIAFGAALLASCVATIIASGSSGSDAISISAIPAVALLVLGIGLMVGSVVGRARWLVLPGVLAVPVLLLTSVVHLPLDGGFGDTFVDARTIDDFRAASHRNAFGSVYVDLARWKTEDGVHQDLSFSTLVGTVTVVVPYDAHVEVDAFTGLGTIGLGPRNVQGVEVGDSAILEPRRGDGATFTLHLEAGLGDIYVLRYGATKKDLRELERQARIEERQGGADR